jgi:MFS family permease
MGRLHIWNWLFRWRLSGMSQSHSQLTALKTNNIKISAVSITLPIIEMVYYYPDKMSDGAETGLRIATLLGAMVGQLGAGFLADIYGRRKVYGWELLLLLGATCGVTMSSRGEGDSMSVYGWMFTWRFFMGIGKTMRQKDCIAWFLIQIARKSQPVYAVFMLRSLTFGLICQRTYRILTTKRYWSRLSTLCYVRLRICSKEASRKNACLDLLCTASRVSYRRNC